MKRKLLCICLGGVALLAGAGSARADGLPVLGVDAGPTGVVNASGDARAVTMPAGGSTVVAWVQVGGGQILRSTVLPGTFTIPAVAYDGSASGLSGDGATLMLISPRMTFPRKRTPLLQLDAQTLQPTDRVDLRGDFSFDALSPNGRWLYLIQYVSPRDPSRYLVRAYDLWYRRLLAAPVVDPRERGEKMRGAPVTRVASADGRWAYTLYDGAGKTPFVHALDTAARSARCIDLDGLHTRNIWDVRLQLSADGRTIGVRERGRRLASIDTRTFAGLTADEGAAPSTPAWRSALLAAVVLLGIGVAAALLLRRRRYRTRLSARIAR